MSAPSRSRVYTGERSAALHRIAPSPASGEPAAATTTVVAIGNSSGRTLTFAAPVTIGAGQELILTHQ